MHNRRQGRRVAGPVLVGQDVDRRHMARTLRPGQFIQVVVGQGVEEPPLHGEVHEIRQSPSTRVSFSSIGAIAFATWPPTRA